MNLSTYNFQFYSYNLATQRNAIYGDNSMDADDIDMSIPPPKPPRTFALHNNSIGGTPQIAWMTSTPRTIAKENQVITEADASKPATAIVNNLAVSNETQKTICTSGLVKKESKSIELQLRPKLHVTQKLWSSELREKALDMSKRNSAGYEEEELENSLATLRLANDEQAKKLKPQYEQKLKSWSCEIREKALDLSKRNSLAFKRTKAEVPPSVLKYFGPQHTSAIRAKEQKSITFQTPLNTQKTFKDADASEKINLTTPANKEQPLQDLSQTVKERISFFNQLNNNSPNSFSFIKLLKNTKTKQQATIQQSYSSNNTTSTQNISNEVKPKRWSTQLEMNYKQDTITNTYVTKSQDNIAVITQDNTTTLLKKNNGNIATLSCSSIASSTTSLSSYHSVASSTQRKCSVRRRTSIEKSRRPYTISRQNSTASSNGTKPQMHTVMEDLSLVMPVKLRVAEYERRIMMENLTKGKK